MTDPAERICKCGHPFAGNHRTPGAECSVLGCDCVTFRDATAPAERIRETIHWCRDWTDGMFTPAHTTDGWTVEMHGLVEGLLVDLPDALAEVERLHKVCGKYETIMEAQSRQIDRMMAERTKAVAEVERLQRERDHEHKMRGEALADVAHLETALRQFFVEYDDPDIREYAPLDGTEALMRVALAGDSE